MMPLNIVRTEGLFREKVKRNIKIRRCIVCTIWFNYGEFLFVYPLTTRVVSRAMASSSLVGMTKTLMALASVLIWRACLLR